MTREDVLNEDVRQQVEEFDRDVDRRLNDHAFMAQDPDATFYSRKLSAISFPK